MQTMSQLPYEPPRFALDQGSPASPSRAPPTATHEFEDGKPAVAFEQVADALEQLRPLTICALNGSVYGGATDCVLACDFALGAEGIEMRMPAATLGLHYYASGVRRYVSRLGVTVAAAARARARHHRQRGFGPKAGARSPNAARRCGKGAERRHRNKEQR
jgi:hypothetical protein